MESPAIRVIHFVARVHMNFQRTFYIYFPSQFTFLHSYKSCTYLVPNLPTHTTRMDLVFLFGHEDVSVDTFSALLRIPGNQRKQVLLGISTAVQDAFQGMSHDHILDRGEGGMAS